MNYTTYHLHTEQSLIDSCTNYKLYVDKAKELGQTAICFTEHGNIYNWYEKKMYCDKNGIKYLHGIECYLTETLNEKVRDNYHTILIAKNQEGFKELNKLIALSTDKKHFYYKPRLSFDEFLSISDNIIKISACLASPLNRLREKYKALLEKYDYYEIQYHNIPEQIEYNQFLFEMSKKYNKPLIAGTDTHSLNKYKAECVEILKLDKWAKDKVGDEFDESEFDLIYKSYDELIKMFEIQNSLPKDVFLKAIDNTNKMADSCEEIVIDTSVKYPYLYGEKDEDVMWDKLRKCWLEKVRAGIITKDQRYVDNIKEEMRVFKKTNMIGFMLFMSEMLTWCKENNIPTSPCRGSVGGSTVAFITNIIDVDPVRWGTIFSRFCNEDRLEVGDIDVDFYDDDRQKVYKYIIDRFGKEKTAYILASGTIVDKGTIDLIGRALHKKGEEKYTLDYVANIKEEYEKNPEYAKQTYPELFYYFDGLVNTVVTQSQHPAGIIASPINLIENYSVFYKDDMAILPINMEEVHEIGLVKYDILGLKNIGVIKKTCEYANIPYPQSHTINWQDQNVFGDMIKSPIGIFQFEGDFAFESLKKFKPKTIDDMSLVNAAIRPSGESYRDDLLAHKPNKNPSELIDELLKENHGFLVYQEDVIAFLQNICGLSGSDADNVRRAIGRKQMDRLQKALPQILEGYCNKSDKPREIAENEARAFLKIIEDASSYMFGYNHSTGYSMVGYLCAYMRYYYPKEFICAFLNCAKNTDDIYNGTILAKEKEVAINKIKFRMSGDDYICGNDNSIYKGLSSIKSMSKTAGSELLLLKNKKYEDFIEVLDDIKELTTINKTQCEILIKLDFFQEFGNINQLLVLKELYEKFGKSKVLTKSKLNPIELECAKKVCKKESEKQFRDFDSKELIIEIYNSLDIELATTLDKLRYEIQLLGTTDITTEFGYYCVEDVDTNKYGTVFIKLYNVHTGESAQYKVDKKWWADNKVVQGDILNCIFDRRVIKRKNSDGEWCYDTNNLEKYLKLYAKVLTN